MRHPLSCEPWGVCLTFLLLMPVHAYQAIIKPQYVDQIPHAVKGSVNKILSAKNDPV